MLESHPTKATSDIATRMYEPVSYSFTYKGDIDYHLSSPIKQPLLFVIKKFTSDEIAYDPQVSQIFKIVPSMSDDERKSVNANRNIRKLNAKCDKQENILLTQEAADSESQFNDYLGLVKRFETKQLNADENARIKDYQLFFDKNKFHFTDLADYLLFRGWYLPEDKTALLKKLSVTEDQFTTIIELLEYFSVNIKQTRLETLFKEHSKK